MLINAKVLKRWFTLWTHLQSDNTGEDSEFSPHKNINMHYFYIKFEETNETKIENILLDAGMTTVFEQRNDRVRFYF